MKWPYIFRVDFENPGDAYSSPMHYLGAEHSGIIVDVFADDIPEIDVDVVVIGGGALMTNKKFLTALDKKLEKIHAKHKIVWGVGFDSDNVDINIQEQFDLFSTREYKLSQSVDWVPCSSVLHPVFDQVESTVPTQDFLVVDHFKRSIPFEKNHTRIINRPNSIHNIVQEIAKHNYVITSSYHVAYWAGIVGRKYAVIGESLPSKFRRMKHFPVIAKTWNDDLYDQAKVWTDARYESTLANYRFSRSVEDLIGIENPAQLAWQRVLRRNNDE